MASSKISELVDAGNLLPGDETIIVRSGANFKVDPTINAVNAWVNFNGTGTVAIRAAYNVSSITDNGTGDYTVNFTNAMTDTNYSVSGTAMRASDNSPSGNSAQVLCVKGDATYGNSFATASVRVLSKLGNDTTEDTLACTVAIIR